MKTKLFFLFLGIILYSSCHEDKFEIDTSVFLENNPLTRSITPQVSKVFNWEDTTSVMLLGHGLVTLPWYSGASTSVPDYILKDYKSADGWTMVYNFCSDPVSAQVGAYYLMFYNYFTGVFRVFFYNINNTTTAGTTLWRVSFDNENAFFNTKGILTLPLSSSKIIPDSYISNISSLPAKSLTRGWNCFDFEILYDPDVNGKSLRMNIGVYDVATSSIEISGNIKLDSEGTIITKTTANPYSSFIDKTATLVGKTAGNYIEKQLENSKTNKLIQDDINNEQVQGRAIGSGIVAAGVSALVKAGVNLLGKAFLGKTSKTDVAIQDLRLRTSGSVDLNGQITNIQQSNILPIANIKVPGAKSFIEDSYLPAMDQSLGVWNLSSMPIVEISDLKRYSLIGVRLDMNRVLLSMSRNIYPKDVSKLVVINPTVLSMIDRYEVSSTFCVSQRENPWDSFDKIGVYYEGTPVFKDSTNWICKDVSGIRINVSVFDNNFIVQRLNAGYDYVVRDTTVGGGGFMKVTVTLYPKIPYDVKEVYSTKTFACKYVLRKEYGVN